MKNFNVGNSNFFERKLSFSVILRKKKPYFLFFLTLVE